MKKTLYLTLFIIGMIVVFVGALFKINAQGTSSEANVLLIMGVLLEIAAFIVYVTIRYKTT